MNKDDIVPISTQEVDAILDALDSFGADVSRQTSGPRERPKAPVLRENRDGCIVLRPRFSRRD